MTTSFSYSGWISMILLLSSPFILIWGWVHYIKLPNRAGWRNHASLFGLLSPILSVAVWSLMALALPGTALYVSSAQADHFMMVGMGIPAIGLIIGLVGRPRLILAIVPACIGALLFWIGISD